MSPAYFAAIPVILAAAWAASGLRSPRARRPLVPATRAVAVLVAVIVGIVPGTGAASSSASGQEVVTVDLGWAPSPNIPWNDITQVELFNLATSAGPALDKSNIQNINVPQWVATAHAHPGIKTLVQIGGEGNNNWGTACNDTNRAQFVQNLINFATTNKFDGVDLDIEDGPWSAIGPPNPAMTTCIEAISNAAHAAGLMLSQDVITNWQGPWLAPSQAYVDQYQLMTFGDSVAQMKADVQSTINQGLPANKFIMGIDITDYAFPADGCAQFATYAAQAGLKGTFIWAARADSDHGNACADALAGISPPPPAPAVSLTPASLTFASQPLGTTSAAQSTTLKNTGNAALTISSISLTGANAANFARTTTCPVSPSTLAAGASCTISVTFTPSASGSRTASVTIADDAAGSPQALALTGTGATSASAYNWAAQDSADFDGDQMTDLGGLYRGRTPDDALWYDPASGGGAAFQIWFGATSDVPVAGDYDGDGKTDAVIFRPSTGLWYGPRTGAAQIVIQMYLGQAGDIPAPGDYDGDKKTDAAIYRPSTGLFFAILSGGGTQGKMLGGSGDVPVPRDYDGDGKTDFATYRPSTGAWNALLSSGGTYTATNGQAGDIPVPADYNGDRRADPVVFRPSNGLWTGPYEGASGRFSFTLGQSGDVPIPGYYDNNKTADVAIFRPSLGLWYTNLSAGGTKRADALGFSTDVPLQRRPKLAGGL